MKSRRGIAELAGPLLVALLAGDERGADDVFRRAVSRGADAAHIARDLIQPALDEVGRLWEKGEIGVAEEHLATSLVARAFLVNAACEQPPALGAPRLVLTCLAGEFHELGARLAAEIGRREGWQVEMLGRQRPAGLRARLHRDEEARSGRPRRSRSRPTSRKPRR